ncbi:SRPBCC domain-containing protein [Brachybacterium sp. FME24]|uniref:SRPBCC family protein n=1 Tax=Brachybacterium sp. FME24 TaxID=2742605 RepID=UPI0018677B4F|nr:SRPBCC domain-containing protein [Brachybacterium sp. FME24]
MPVTDISHDLDALTLTITAEFAAPARRIWDIYADPRQLEKVWGPKEYPATVVDHDLTPGGRVTYYMTGPDGDRFYGYWGVLTVEEPRSFSYEDGFAHEDFTPNTALPISTCVSTFTEQDGTTQAVYVTSFASREGLQTVLDMGVEEGSRSAINQIDDLVA